MPGRDDFGSNAGRPGGAGGYGNGGVGGGMGGGYGGGGAGRNAGIGSRMGMMTGAQMPSGTAYGRPGGMATFTPPGLANRPQGLPPGILARLQQSSVVPVGAPPPNPILQMPNYMPAFMDPIQGPNFLNLPGLMTHQPPPMQMPANGIKYQDRLPGGVAMGGR